MSIADKLTTIAENTPKVYNAGYEKGKAEFYKEEQEKTVNIFENGTAEILPDDGKLLSKVTVDVDVPIADIFSKIIDGSITEVIIPENITVLRSYAFANCSNLSKVVLHEKITFLGYSCFHLCYALKDLILPSSITTIDPTAISRCDNLVNLVINCKLTKSIYLNQAKDLSDKSVDNVINALADLTGQTPQSLTLHPDVKAKLTEEQITVITSKNWTLA